MLNVRNMRLAGETHYSTMGMAYGDVMKWIEENDYEIIGLPRESYIDGIWNKEHSEEWLTEIQIPVK